MNGAGSSDDLLPIAAFIGAAGAVALALRARRHGRAAGTQLRSCSQA